MSPIRETRSTTRCALALTLALAGCTMPTAPEGPDGGADAGTAHHAGDAAGAKDAAGAGDAGDGGPAALLCPCAAGNPSEVADPDRELFIRDVSVVNDSLRAFGTGDFSFGHLMTELAPQGTDPADFVSDWLSTWLFSQTVNTFNVPARPAMQALLSAWPKGPDGKIDLAQAPFRLRAIVNRMDLRQPPDTSGLVPSAGEGRFVFILTQTGFPVPFLVIFEYQLPATTLSEVQGWACQWHQLGAMQFGPSYNAALQTLTERFVARGQAPAAPNGSAILRVRTNDFHLGSPWELREFHLDPATGALLPAPVALTPDLSLQNSAVLADYINQNQASILLDQHVVPASFEGQPFLGGSAPFLNNNSEFAWAAPGVDPDARHHFSLNTCMGCHGGETRGSFFQVNYNTPLTQPAQLSGFLTGITVADPVSGVQRNFADLARRQADLEGQIQCREAGGAERAEALRPRTSRID